MSPWRDIAVKRSVMSGCILGLQGNLDESGSVYVQFFELVAS